MSSYAVIFTSVRSAQDPAGYEAMAQRMVDKAKLQKGFLGMDSVRDPSGTGITVSYWESLDSIKAWRADAEHQDAQSAGREKWYENFKVRICKVEREYGAL